MSYERPSIKHLIPTRWGWTVSNPEGFTYGDGVDIGNGVYIMAKHGVTIGENSQIGAHCRLYSVDSEGGFVGSIEIGQCVNVGCNTSIFPDVVVGDGVVIGAHSMVMRGTRMEAGSTWLGCPAVKQSKVWAITGGTGSIGRAIVEYLLEHEDMDSIRVISRDEAKHAKMQTEIKDDRVRYIIGDVTDSQAMTRALRGVNICVHAAAMKRVETSEYNAGEVARVNIGGTQSVADACLACKVKKMLLVSTDKSVNPIGVMGKSKSLAESLILDQYMRIGGYTKFYVVRLGNILGSRGSVLEIWDNQDVVEITDPEATRFFLTKFECASWITTRFNGDPGLHIPKCRAIKMGDMAEVYCEINGKKSEVVGLRPGEKVHEELCLAEEAERMGIECYRSNEAELMSKEQIKELLTGGRE